jgi:hypothetical protein
MESVRLCMCAKSLLRLPTVHVACMMVEWLPVTPWAEPNSIKTD